MHATLQPTLRPTGRIPRTAFFRRLSLSATVLVSLALLRSDFLQAAESITAFVDASGRVIFINDGGELLSSSSPAASGSASGGSASGVSTSGRRLVASTGPDSTAASPGASYPASEPVFTTPLAATGSGTTRDLNAIIEQAAQRHQIDPDLIRAIVRVESNFDPYAVSPKGARGLMQLIPATAQRFGVANPFDPHSNLDGGIRYLKHLLGMYQGDLRLSLAAYNAGEQAVARSGGVPAYRETQNYIRKIAELYPLRPIPAGIPSEPVIEKFVDGKGVVHFSNIDQP